MILKNVLPSRFLCNTLKSNLFNSCRAMSTEEDVIFESIKNIGVITLNRPKALNALNLPMVRKISSKLTEWENQKSFVIIKGSGEKAFCAGGDVRAIAESGLKGGKLGYEFFREEYQLNGFIGNYKVPYIALIDGIVMGGGVGLSVHGTYRVATERTLFAMPETLIGLFPDVGVSYVLSRLKGNLGIYLALTGYRLKGSDVLHSGIATHYSNSKEMPELKSALLNCTNESDIVKTLKQFSKPEQAFSLAPVLTKIDKCFGAATIELILKALAEDGSEWAQSTISTLSKMSPSSLKISLKVLHGAAKLSLRECLQMDYRVASGCLKNKDFYEGVRALLIDKDQKPLWNPPVLDLVSDEIVDSYFVKLSEDKELRMKL